MKRKSLGILKLFTTKGQHNDDAVLSGSKSVNGPETLKRVEMDVTGKVLSEVSAKPSTDNLIPLASTTDNRTKEKVKVEPMKLKSENLGLKRILAHKRTIPAGIVLSSVGVACLLFAYLQSSLIFTFTGLGLVLWGTLILYISPSRQIPAELMGSFSLSTQKSINELIKFTGYTGDAIFFHPQTLAGFGQGYVFISHYTYKTGEKLESKLDALNRLPYSSEMKIPSLYVDTSGLFLAAPSQGLVDLIEQNLNVNLATVDINFLQEKLPKLLIEDLKIIDSLSIEEESQGSIGVTVSGGPLIDICQRISKEGHLGNALGCPLCSTLALIISKVSGNPVNLKESSIREEGQVLHNIYALINQK